jgi:hypothetical protein
MSRFSLALATAHFFVGSGDAIDWPDGTKTGFARAAEIIVEAALIHHRAFLEHEEALKKRVGAQPVFVRTIGRCLPVFRRYILLL